MHESQCTWVFGPLPEMLYESTETLHCVRLVALPPSNQLNLPRREKFNGVFGSELCLDLRQWAHKVSAAYDEAENVSSCHCKERIHMEVDDRVPLSNETKAFSATITTSQSEDRSKKETVWSAITKAQLLSL